MKKINYFAYISFILTIVLVYLFGELKYEKKMARTKELWLLEDTSELEDHIGRLEEMVQYLSKKNREYEAVIAVIKLKIEKDRQDKQDEQQRQQPKPQPQSTVPSVPKGYPGIYIPKGQKSPNKLNNPFAV